VLRYQLVADLPAVSADATQIRQIVMNLVMNASEAIGGHDGVITLATGRMKASRDYLNETHHGEDLPEGDYVYLEVQDSGAGMDEATRAKIFDPFFTTKFTGRGLGLAAVLGIVRGHRGTLKVYSEPGRGSAFKLLLPVVEGGADSEGAASREAVRAWFTGSALVVDDENHVRKVVVAMLESFGFQVYEAGDGVEGLEQFRKHAGELKLVLMDLTMPRMDGEEAFRAMRNVRAGVPVLLMSGFNQQEAIKRFAGKGLAGFIQKPFDVGRLGQTIREVLSSAGPE
jgi:CheY-like chemotaxis protein